MKDLTALKNEKRIERILRDAGVEITKSGGNEVKCCCPLPDHNDTNASFYINTMSNVFKCHGCGAEGSVLDLVMKLNNCPLPRAAEILSGEGSEDDTVQVKVVPKVRKDGPPPRQTAEFVYRSETSKKLFFVKRFVDSDGNKTFRQGHFNEHGVEIMSMKDVQRVPYNLHLFGREGLIYHCEGEKCADALCAIGLTATTSVGGSGGWLDAYASYYKDRDVVILPDHDEPGEKYAEAVLKSIKLAAKSVRVLRMGGPGRPKGYDIADWISEMREEVSANADGARVDTAEEVRTILESRVFATTPMVKGFELNINSMADLKRIHKTSTDEGATHTFSIHKHLPTLEGVVRPFKTGDCVFLKGPTGSAKTLLAQAIARWAAPMKCLIFEIELLQEHLFARWAAMENDCEIDEVASLHSHKDGIRTAGLEHIYVCPCSSPTPQYIEETINRAELVMGERPQLVVIDYIQLVRWPGKCSRYERFSNIAEYFRVMANSTRTICIVISQVARPDSNIKGERVPSRYDGKESGSLENSATILLDIAPTQLKTVKKITVLKDTHSGFEGLAAEVGFVGEKALFGEPVHSCGDVF